MTLELFDCLFCSILLCFFHAFLSCLSCHSLSFLALPIPFLPIIICLTPSCLAVPLSYFSCLILPLVSLSLALPMPQIDMCLKGKLLERLEDRTANVAKLLSSSIAASGGFRGPGEP